MDNNNNKKINNISPGVSDGKEFACKAGNLSLIPGSGRSPGAGNGNPLQCSCLENPMDRGAWWLQSMGSQRVGHNWVTNTYLYSTYYVEVGTLLSILRTLSHPVLTPILKESFSDCWHLLGSTESSGNLLEQYWSAVETVLGRVTNPVWPGCVPEVLCEGGRIPRHFNLCTGLLGFPGPTSINLPRGGVHANER